MKVALLGAGRIGRMHGRLLAATPGVDAVVIADADAARAAEVAAEVGATAAPTIEAAMDAADAVVIAAATTAHAELIRASIGRGLPTFCEKPLAADLDDTLAVADEIERSGVPVPARLPAAVRRRLSRGAPPGRDRRTRDPLRRPPGRSRPCASARVVHPAVRWPVPRLFHPRLRYPALADRLRGRGGLCRWGRPGLPGVRQVRRRRHGRGDAAHDGRTVRRR